MTRTIAYRARRKRARDKRRDKARLARILLTTLLNTYRTVRQMQRMFPNADLHL
jgi:hypothetical protein